MSPPARTAADIVREALRLELTDEHGRPVRLQLEPPGDDEEVRELESRLPCPLPEEIRDLLKLSAELRNPPEPLNSLSFLGDGDGFGLDNIFPHGMSIAGDGCGNFWVVDLLPGSTTWGPIYYACHDPPVILYQSATLAEFLSEMFKLWQPPYTGAIADVYEDRLFHVWRSNPRIQEYADCLASGDAELKAFAAELGPAFQIIDLRNAPVGFGFSWGRYGGGPNVRRHGNHPIFAYERKERKRWFGLFGR